MSDKYTLVRNAILLTMNNCSQMKPARMAEIAAALVLQVLGIDNSITEVVPESQKTI
jgi:hypothetical protein